MDSFVLQQLREGSLVLEGKGELKSRPVRILPRIDTGKACFALVAAAVNLGNGSAILSRNRVEAYPVAVRFVDDRSLTGHEWLVIETHSQPGGRGGSCPECHAAIVAGRGIFHTPFNDNVAATRAALHVPG